MLLKPGVPAYRRRIIRGREVAIVTLCDSVTGRRRDFWLGDFGMPESYLDATNGQTGNTT